MASHIQCLRCYKNIPIKPEMIGQTILCPSCLERVYVTGSDQPLAKTTNSQAATDLRPNVSAALAAARAATRGGGESRSLPIGLIAGIGGGIALLLVVGLVMWSASGSPNGKQLTAQSAGPPAPPTEVTAPPRTPPQPPGAELSSVSSIPRPPQNPADGESPSAGTALTSDTQRAAGKSQPAKTPPPSPTTSPVVAKAPSVPPAANPTSTEVWRLPPTTASVPEVLTSVGEEAAWRITAKPPTTAVAMRPGALSPSVIVEPDGDPGTWTLKYATYALTGATKEPLAALRRTGGDLTFAWASPLPPPELRKEVANCLIEISAGPQRRVGQLREPVRLNPIAVDWSIDKQLVETQLADLPRPEALRLEVSELIGFASEAKVRGGVKSASVSTSLPVATFPQMQTGGASSLVIEFAEVPGLEVRVGLRGPDPAGKLAVSLDPVFRENQIDHDLSVRGLLDRLEAEVEKPLTNARRDLPSAESALSRARADETKLKANEPPANDARRRPGWESKRRDLTFRLGKFENEFNALKRQIDTYQARLDAVTKLRAFLKLAADKQAQIHFTVTCECGEPDLLLVDGRGQAPVASQ